jgi:drug/metabolite transporter (DMT)-like permease
MKPRNMYRIVIGILFIITGAVTILSTPGNTVLPAILLAAGAAFLATGIVRHRRYGDDPESDERSKKIGAYGLSYAWLTGTVGITLLFWAEYAGIVHLEGPDALELSVLLLVIPAIVFQAYLLRKGDVE